jgi:hypothetical protein
MLDTSREYVWFLSNVEVRPIKKQQTIVLDWTCKEAPITVREYLRICSPFVGCRLHKTMLALGWDEKNNPNTPPETFFEKGLHIKAKPIMYWSELNSEDMKYKLNYESLSPMNEQTRTLTDEERKILDRICSTKRTYSDTFTHLASHKPELAEPFMRLCKSGEIKLDGEMKF